MVRVEWSFGDSPEGLRNFQRKLLRVVTSPPSLSPFLPVDLKLLGMSYNFPRSFFFVEMPRLTCLDRFLARRSTWSCSVGALPRRFASLPSLQEMKNLLLVNI